jgi:hypothetical protein
MKIISFKLLIALMFIAALTVSALAFSTPDEPVLGDNEPLLVDDETIVTDTEMLEEVLIGDDEKATIMETIDFNSKTIPLTESVKAVIDNATLNDGINIKFEEWEASSNDKQMVNRDAALKTAFTYTMGMGPQPASADAINVVLVKFSDIVLRKLPASDISLIEIPVWLVTVENIRVFRHGGDMVEGESEPDRTVLVDANVVVDAYSGDILQVIAYGTNMQK